LISCNGDLPLRSFHKTASRFFNESALRVTRVSAEDSNAKQSRIGQLNDRPIPHFNRIGQAEDAFLPQNNTQATFYNPFKSLPFRH
jgi:hypothetical protein